MKYLMLFITLLFLIASCSENSQEEGFVNTEQDVDKIYEEQVLEDSEESNEAIDSEEEVLSCSRSYENELEYCEGAIECGEDENNCYDNREAIEEGLAITPSEKCLELINNIWVEALNNKTLAVKEVIEINNETWEVNKEDRILRILAADGSDNWQFKLDAEGLFHTEYYFTDNEQIGGRACPVEGCLYYDNGIKEVNNVERLSRWESKADRGNIEHCSSKNMRLPILKETSFKDVNGVPSVEGNSTWTTSPFGRITKLYSLWKEDDTDAVSYDLDQLFYVRCVLP